VLLSRDTYDPRGFVNGAVPVAYALDLNIRNNLVRAATDPATSFSASNRRPDANDIELLGFDMCWFRADPESGNADAAKFGSWDDGIPDRLKCSSLPATQKRFVAAAGSITPDGGLLGLSVPILDAAALRTLYGNEFDPIAIPAVGGTTVNGPYYYAPTAPTDTVRDAAWGNYPHDYMARVVVQAQAVGKQQDGDTLESNWFVFPIDVCVGCTADVCGPTTVVAATCPSTGTVSLSGAVVGPTSCVPSQSGGGAPTCVDSWTNCF
jgi:hypothetical protein